LGEHAIRATIAQGDEGVPNVQRLGRVNVGETVPEQLHEDE